MVSVPALEAAVSVLVAELEELCPKVGDGLK